MKTMIAICIFLLIGDILGFSYLIRRDWNKPEDPANVEYFKTGDILNPDYAIPDTLIVKDAAKLNKEMQKIEQGFIDATDGEIATIFYKYCNIK